jgi:hypothetical protein
MGIAQIVFFVIFGPNGDFDEEIMKGKRRFGARFGFAFLQRGRGTQPWRRWAQRSS